MSYCRFSSICEDGRKSDVYVIGTGEGFECYCGAELMQCRWEMISHLEWHIAQGDAVPRYAIERLKKEIAEEKQ